jgi:hypothetical protein
MSSESGQFQGVSVGIEEATGLLTLSTRPQAGAEILEIRQPPQERRCSELLLTGVVRAQLRQQDYRIP